MMFEALRAEHIISIQVSLSLIPARPPAPGSSWSCPQGVVVVSEELRFISVTSRFRR